MCLIIAPGKDGKPALLPQEAFDYAYSRNNEGFGGMWVEDGRVQHFKTLGLTREAMYDQMQEQVERHPDIIFHMRLKTHGKIIVGLSHPFRILNKKRHGKDLFFMHNGILSSFGNNLTYGQSDTTAFKDKILIPLLTRDPDALDDPEVMDSINKLTTGSRLVFMDSEGKTYFTSENSWNNRYGLTCSNTYMLPSEKYEPFNDETNNTIVTNKALYVTAHPIFFRTIDRGGIVAGHWCSCPKLGFIRTEAGLLYRDNGPNNKIYHSVNYIDRGDEFKHLGIKLVTNDDIDDDIPFDLTPSVDRSESKNKSPAPEDQRLRYARLLQNMYAGKVTSRPHLMADFIGMQDKELDAFVAEDPETASVALAELIEMVLEYNDVLWRIDPNHPMILNADELLRIGQSDYHRLAIQEITKIRKQDYENQIKQLFGDNEEEVNVA